jgi:asparagine synthase (glutamine-hydrolysing)
MCGIAGKVNYLSGAPADAEVIRAMCRLLAHRGPDGEGVYTDGHVGLGHRRLSIIDLSPAGSQPMSYADGSLVITFNGEIYNFLALRERLEREGYRFCSHTDTEVVLAAYQAWGLDFLQHLRGMFAFALWDAPRRRLVLARDRVGKKPLHYRLDRHGITFVSEPRAFLADPDFVPRPNLEGIFHYLSFQYVPTPMSGFDGVRKLPPAHYLVIEGQQVRIERYWRLQYGEKRRVTEEAASEELLGLLKEAVRIRLMSDVPLGAFLSGGIDSGTIVALMSQLGTSRVKTFSIGFEEKEYDELPFARQVAQRYGTEHHEFVVRPEAAAILPKLVWHYSEPYADSSAVPTYYLSELTRRHVTVALNGDAGDENFAGYERYVANVLADRHGRLPAVVGRPLKALLSRIPRWGGPKAPLARLGRFADALSEPVERRYAQWMMHFRPSAKEWLCTPGFLEATGNPDSVALIASAYAQSNAGNLVDATLDVDVQMYLPDDLLVKVDIATMAHGLEGRSPFLDQEVMEFAAGLPAGFKLRGRTKKYLLKRAVRDLLPQGIIERPKMGFGVPLDHWFREDLREMAYDVLLSARSMQRGYFDPTFVRSLLDEHTSGKANWHYHLWNLLMLELWHRTFIDGRPSGDDR